MYLNINMDLYVLFTTDQVALTVEPETADMMIISCEAILCGHFCSVHDQNIIIFVQVFE